MIAGRILMATTLFGFAMAALHAAAASDTVLMEQMATVQEFQDSRAPENVWTEPAEPAVLNDRGRAILSVLGSAEREGLVARDYRVPPTTDRSALERAVSLSLLRFLTDLRSGRLAPYEADPELFLARPSVDGLQLLSTVADADDPVRAIAQVGPRNPIYHRLRRALADYRQRAVRGGWPSVAVGDPLKPGMRDPRVAALRERLTVSESLTLTSDDPELYDEGFGLAMRGFQRRHGLEADGVVGARTVAALNVPIEHRIEQIVLNMERFRWMPDEFGDDHVFVNLADFTLDYVHQGLVAMSMRVIVGRQYRETPVFSDRIRYLELNPTWTVPAKIASEDLLAKIRTNPSYLASGGFKVLAGSGDSATRIDPATVDWAGLTKGRFPFTLRQQPGLKNALGRVKFMFPNRFDIYLHDTPGRELFRRSVRTFSSGCIRLENPIGLARRLLAADGQDPDRIAPILESAKTTRINLAKPVPVHLSYLTAWVGEGGTLEFRDDVYGRDALLAKALGLGDSS